MLPEYTPDIEKILANQILTIEQVNGHLSRTVLVGDDEDNQQLILIFSDGRWASITPALNGSRGTWGHHEKLLGVHVMGEYCKERHCWNHYVHVETLYHVGLVTKTQWRAYLNLQERRREE